MFTKICVSIYSVLKWPFKSYLSSSGSNDNLICLRNYNEVADPDTPICMAANLLHNGCLIALPTETEYCLAADAQSYVAVERLMKLHDHCDITRIPNVICVADAEEAFYWGNITFPVELICQLLLNEVTIVVERSNHLKSPLFEKQETIGIRICSEPFVRQIIRCTRSPIILVGKNRKVRFRCYNARQFVDVWPRVEAVFDNGDLEGANRRLHCLGPTVVDLSMAGEFNILKRGSTLISTIRLLSSYGLVCRYNYGQN